VTETLLELIDRPPARGRLEAWWSTPIGGLEAHGVPSSALPVFAAWLALRAQRPVLALVSDPASAAATVHDDIAGAKVTIRPDGTATLK